MGLSSAATTKPQNHRRGLESGSLRGARPELGTSIGIRKSYLRGKGRSQLHKCSPHVLQCRRGPAAVPPSPDPHPLGDQRRCKLLEKLCPDPTLIKSSDLVPGGTLPSNLENQGGRLAAGGGPHVFRAPSGSYSALRKEQFSCFPLGHER